MLIWRNNWASVFGFANPGDSPGQRPAYGLGIKLDGTGVGRPAVRHFSVGVYGPMQQIGRGCWTWEALTWRTDGHGAKAKRLSIKAFVRIKIGLGGAYPTTRPKPETEAHFPAGASPEPAERRATRDEAEWAELARKKPRAPQRGIVSVRSRYPNRLVRVPGGGYMQKP